MKRWQRDLGLVRELGPDEPRFDAAVARVWADLEGREREIEQLRQTCAISFSDKDTGIKTLIARAEAAEAELQRVKAERDELENHRQDNEEIEGEARECPYCDGHGWSTVAVHDPTDPDGEPLPEQEQCATCGGSGVVAEIEGEAKPIQVKGVLNPRGETTVRHDLSKPDVTLGAEIEGEAT